MSSLIRGPDGKIKLYCKGADTVIVERLSQEEQAFTEITLNQLEVSPGLFYLPSAYLLGVDGVGIRNGGTENAVHRHARDPRGGVSPMVENLRESRRDHQRTLRGSRQGSRND